MFPQDLLSRRNAAEGHEAARVGRIGLDDRHERDLSGHQSIGDGVQRGFVGNRQTHGVGAVGQIPGTTLASCMHDVRGLDSAGQVRPNNDVVEQVGNGRVAGNAGAIARRSCPQSSVPSFRVNYGRFFGLEALWP